MLTEAGLTGYHNEGIILPTGRGLTQPWPDPAVAVPTLWGVDHRWRSLLSHSNAAFQINTSFFFKAIKTEVQIMS